MKYYAVVDTNVIVSGTLFKESVPGRIIRHVYNENVIPLINEKIINEYEEVLNRSKFKFAQEEIQTLLAYFKSNGISMESKEFEELMSDESDIVFYGVTLSAKDEFGSNTFLITGNTKHFPKKEFVVTPKEMNDILDSDKKINKI